MPCAQSKIIEQAKSTNSPLCKAFEKQINTTKDKEEKQTKVLEDHRKQQWCKKKYSVEKDSLKHSKQKDIFEKLTNRRMEFNLFNYLIIYLIYPYKTKNGPKTFLFFKSPLKCY